ncbi:MAG: CHAT domain-containing protein [Coleofasciculus chthonoplastes F3-SA18-01]|uniref:CHAT domain-containing protein n=1 Tax=Coleofasciculus chthonoplastes TaxID=64178 RepID=UPI0032F51875
MTKNNRHLLIGFLLGLFLFISIPPVLSQINPITPPIQSAAQSITQGRTYYAAKEYQQAIHLWRQAAQRYETQGDTLHQAQALSYLSLAYQKLHHWTDADTAITASLNLLDTLAESTERSRLYAQALNHRGRLELALGRAESALATWKQATQTYQQLNDDIGVTGSLFNQAQAMEALGFYRRACQISLQAFQVDNHCNLSESGELDAAVNTFKQQSQPAFTVVGLRNLGNVLRLVGHWQESQTILHQALDLAKQIDSPSQQSATLLSLGKTQYAIYRQDKDLWERSNITQNRDNAKEWARAALNTYQQAATINTDSTTLPLEAQLHHLRLLIEFQQWLQTLAKTDKTANPAEFTSQIQSQVQTLLQSPLANLEDSKIAIYSQLSFAQTLLKLPQYDPNFSHALDYTQAALNQAQSLDNKRAESEALGTLAHIYEQNQNWSDAQDLTHQALGLAQSLNTEDLAYKWLWQSGRIYWQQQQKENAIHAYNTSINVLNSVRRNLLAINPGVQFSFLDDVRPIYQQFLEILLQPDANLDHLRQATRISEALQLAELEDFLRCSFTNLVPIDQNQNPPAAIIYPILLKNRLEVLIKLPQSESSPEKVYRYTPQVSAQDFSQTLYDLRQQLDDPRNPVDSLILPPAQKLYNWLLKSAQTDLPQTGTLVFVLDSTLQNLPIAILHDSQHYLVETYNIAISLGSQLPNLNPLSPTHWQGLLAGINKKAESYPPKLPALSSVWNELHQIHNTVPSQLLENEQFTQTNFRNQLINHPFSVIHLATHGEFSSDATQTVIYAWDKKIPVEKFGQLLQQRQQTRREPIQLLVLSACQTASGDRRAALGLAGVALRANASSTVASLWRVSDNSTAQLMDNFYQQLNQGIPKAEALANVQRKFINNPDNPSHKHPYYWAAFILAGNWF